jgi:hypothetical protein
MIKKDFIALTRFGRLLDTIFHRYRAEKSLEVTNLFVIKHVSSSVFE